MQTSIHYDQCPVCHSTAIREALTVKDYTVSGQAFVVWHCEQCTARFTQDVPAAAAIGAYYQSNDYISHTNTTRGIVNQLYHRVRTWSLKQKKEWIEKATGKKQGILLDVGAGMGTFAAYMREQGWQVTALEPDAGTRERALAEYKITLQPVEQLYELPAGSFDVITLWHVLEHVHELHRYIQTLRDLLRPGGRLLIAVPNYTSRDAAIYQACWAAYDVPRHLYHFSPQSMRVLLKEHGLHLEHIQPMWFDSFYVSMLSEKYKTGKGGLVKGVISGLRSNMTAMGDKEKCSSLVYIISKPEA